MRTARAKGLSERVVTLRHALRNAMIPIITVLGLDFGAYLTGSILTETVFSWPGLGRYVANEKADGTLPADFQVERILDTAVAEEALRALERGD